MRACGIGLGLLTFWLLAFPLARAGTGQEANPGPPKSDAVEGPGNSDWELLFPEGDGKSYVLAYCQTCHNLKPVAFQRRDEPAWRGLLGQMSAQGANLEGEDISIMAPYLAEHFGPEKPPLEVPLDLNRATAEQLVLLPDLTKEEMEKIVNVRKTKTFKNLTDLKEVISDEKIAHLKPFVVVR